jgi:hypothetical protein
MINVLLLSVLSGNEYKLLIFSEYYWLRKFDSFVLYVPKDSKSYKQLKQELKELMKEIYL